MWLRPRTSDLEVFDLIFRYREYRCLDTLREPRLIIDCGANVGFSSVYFLSRFPQAYVIAVEPDAENFIALQRNLASYSGRTLALQAAIWSHPCELVVSRGGDGREWARTVREGQTGEKTMVAATDIGALIARTGFERVSVLKIDIEGAEAQVFSSDRLEWLKLVDTIVIELHGNICAAVFHSAIADEQYEITTCDELTVCIRRTS